MGNQCCSADFVLRDGFAFRNKPKDPLPIHPPIFEPLLHQKTISQHETVNNYFFKTEGNWMLQDESVDNDYQYASGEPLEIVKQPASQNSQQAGCVSDRILNPTFLIDTKILESTRSSDSPFCDAEFQPSIESLCTNMSDFPISFEIDWLRVNSFSEKPYIFSSTLEPRHLPHSIVAGQLNDHYFLAALCSLAEHPFNLTRLFESDIDANEKGFYSVWLNHDGLWKLIVIDDYFPCAYASPAFSKSNDSNEVWVLILEKAYAKLFGSYHRIENGYPEEAITDLTGSPFDMISIAAFGIDATWSYIYKITQLHRTSEDNNFNATHILIADQPKRSLRPFSSSATSDQQEQTEPLYGVTAHAILDAKEVELLDGSIERIVKLRNHWNPADLLLGDWAENSHKWTSHSREACGMSTSGETTREGIQWLSIERFCEKYSTVSCNYLHPDYMFNSKAVTKQLMTMIELNSQFQLSVVKMSAKSRNSSGYIQFHQKDVRNSENTTTAHAGYRLVRMMAFSGHPGEICSFLGEVTSRSRNAFIPISLGYARDFFVVISVEGADEEGARNPTNEINPITSELVVSAYTNTEVWFSSDDEDDREQYLSSESACDAFLDACLLRVPPVHSNDEHVYFEDESIFRYSSSCFGYVFFAYINESHYNTLDESIVATLVSCSPSHKSAGELSHSLELAWKVELKPQSMLVKKYRMKPQPQLQSVDQQTQVVSGQEVCSIKLTSVRSKVSPSAINSHTSDYLSPEDVSVINAILESARSGSESNRRARKVDGIEQPVYFYSHISSEGIAFYYENQTKKTYCENLRLALVNLHFANGSIVPPEINVVIPPGQGKLLHFKTVNPNEKTSFKLDFTSFFQA